MQGTYGVDNIILDLDIVDVNAVDTVLCRPYYFRTCDCRPNSKRNCRPKSVELMDGSRCRNLNKINMLNHHLAGAFPFLLRHSVVAHKRTPKGGRRKEAGFDLLSGIILL